MRQVKSSLEVARKQKFKTLSSVSKTPEEIEHLANVGLDNNQAAQVLAKERARAVKFEASVKRSQQKLLKSREKMAVLVNRNRALTSLRHEIQRERDLKTAAPATTQPVVKPEKINHGSLRGMELKY